MENASVESSAPVSSATEGVSQSSVSPSSEVSKEGQPKLTGNETQEELVEIALGQRKMKLSKADAENVKGFEKAAREAMRESSMTKKQYSTFMETVRSNPRAALQQLGIDPLEFAEMTLTERVQEMSKSPEQRELDQLRAEKKAYQEEAQRRKEEGERAELSKKEQEYKQKLDNDLVAGFKDSGLHTDEASVRMVAGFMMAAAKRGEDLSAEDACRMVMERTDASLKLRLAKLPLKELRAFIGESRFKELREDDVSRLTSKVAPTPSSGAKTGTQANASYPSARKGPERPMNEREFRAYQQSLKD